MRRSLLALALFGLITEASAGDFFDRPILRGSDSYPIGAPSYARWEGFYGGGQLGYGSAHVDFSQATKSLVAYSLRTTALENQQHPSQWEVLGAADTKVASIGGFVGYNAQWDDAILGLELNYNRGSFSAIAPNSPITRVTAAGGNTYLVTVTGSGTAQITDMATLRGRAGWVIGNFMPYATLGFAVARANLTRSATVFGQENPNTPCDGTVSPPCTPFNFTQSEAKPSTYLYGWALGGGVDFALLPNVFLRGEVEYAAFIPVSGIAVSLTTARVGAGLKF